MTDRGGLAASYPRVELRPDCDAHWYCRLLRWHVIDLPMDGAFRYRRNLGDYPVSCHLTYRAADRAVLRMERQRRKWIARRETRDEKKTKEVNDGE